MGDHNYLVDKQNKTFYQLGRGVWTKLQDCFDYFQDEKLLWSNIFSIVYMSDEPDDVVYEITTRLAQDLHNNFKYTPKNQLQIINDSVDDIYIFDDLYILKRKGYRFVGSRYRDQK
jgi:hypothetical protein